MDGGKRRKNTNTLKSIEKRLPDELIIEILTYLDAIELIYSIPEINRYFHKITSRKNNILWKQLLFHRITKDELNCVQCVLKLPNPYESRYFQWFKQMHRASILTDNYKRTKMHIEKKIIEIHSELLLKQYPIQKRQVIWDEYRVNGSQHTHFEDFSWESLGLCPKTSLSPFFYLDDHDQQWKLKSKEDMIKFSKILQIFKKSINFEDNVSIFYIGHTYICVTENIEDPLIIPHGNGKMIHPTVTV